MILVIGGRGAGKRNFVAQVLGYGPEACSADPEDRTPVLYDLEQCSPLPPVEALLRREVVVCREVGCGVIPMDAQERNWREAVGRLCCALAAQAEAVYRVSCGLGMRLK